MFLLNIHDAFYHSLVFIGWDITLQRLWLILPLGSKATFIDYVQKHPLFLLNSVLKVKTLGLSFLYCIWTYSPIISLKKKMIISWVTLLSFDDYVADGLKSTSGTQMNLQENKESSFALHTIYFSEQPKPLVRAHKLIHLLAMWLWDIL